MDHTKLIPADHPILTGDRRYPIFSVDVSGTRHAAVTDGYCAFSVETDDNTIKASSQSATLSYYMTHLPRFVGTAHVRDLVTVGGNLDDELEPCGECSGRGFKFVRKCWECNGEGEVECDKGHYHDCEECDGHGWEAATANDDSASLEKETCEVCGGTGKGGPRVIPLLLEGVHLDAKILRRTLATPPRDEKVRIYTNGDLDPIHIVGKGWRAIVMPRRPSTDDLSAVTEVLLESAGAP